MKREDIKLNHKYRANLHPGRYYVYEVIQLNKKSCNVRIWKDDKPTDEIVRQVPYHKLF